jgi:hypothetical protein
MNPSTGTRGRSRKRTIAGIAAATLAAFACAEVAARVVGLGEAGWEVLLPPECHNSEIVLDPGPELCWWLHPGTSIRSVNRFGLRGYEPAAGKGDADLRILCVGESVVFGAGVDLHQAFGMRLERLLQASLPGARVETLLGGLPGWSSHQARVLLQRLLRDFAPDVAVVHTGAWGDLMPAFRVADAAFADLRRPQGLRLLRMVTQLCWRFGPSAAELGSDVAHAPFGRRVPLPEFRRNLVDIVAQLRAAGSAVVLAIPALRPDARQLVADAERYRQAQAEVAAELRVPVVDVAAALDAEFGGNAAALASPAVYVDGLHLGPVGHEVVARALHAAIAAMALPRCEELRRRAAPPPLAPGLTFAVAARPGETIDLPAGIAALGAERLALGDVPVAIAGAGARRSMQVPLPMRAGRHDVAAITPCGPVALGTVEVAPLELGVSAARRGEDLDVAFSLAAPRDAVVFVTGAAALRDAPAPTAFGPFWLAGPAGAEHASIEVEIARREHLRFVAGADGMHATLRLPADVARERKFVQALVVWPDAGWVLTGAARIDGN